MFAVKKNQTFEEEEDGKILKQSFGRKKRQTIGELAELVEKYDHIRNQVLQKRVKILFISFWKN